MSTTATRTKEATTARRVGKVDQKLEVVIIPVSDVERAKEFYGGLGWRLDADFITDKDHVVQFTPPGSQCSIHFGTNLTTAAPGSAQGMFLIVSDIQAARDELMARGVEVSEVFHFAGWNRIAPDARVSGPSQDRPSYGSFMSFSDPDGNSWLVQQITTRLPGRIDPGAISFGSANDLASAFRRAEKAHGEHERRRLVRHVHGSGAGGHRAPNVRHPRCQTNEPCRALQSPTSSRPLVGPRPSSSGS
jgi:catechol 2,3-dioxygenase-like lactoylglutathione lyase family enzyme